MKGEAHDTCLLRQRQANAGQAYTHITAGFGRHADLATKGEAEMLKVLASARNQV